MPNEETKTPYTKETMPFVAPCNQIGIFACIGWLQKAWGDLQRAPKAALLYGGVMTAIVAILTLAAWVYGNDWLIVVMFGGFVFLAPLFCIGLYAISAQLERDQPVELVRTLRAALRRHIGNELIFAVVLLAVFMIWARAGMMLSVFVPVDLSEGWQGYFTFLSIGTVVGAFFALVTFSASAFSLPMIMHRDVDTITAVVTSVNAVLRNRMATLIWLVVIMLGLLIGIFTFFVGLVVIFPLIGFAAWHGYQETINAEAFPRHTLGITAIPKSP